MLPGIRFPWKFSLNLSKFCQASMNVWLFRFLPFSVSKWYLAFWGKIYYLFKRREKKLIQRTIRYIFGGELDQPSLKTLIKKTFRGIIDHYHEKLFVAYSNFPRLLNFLKTRVELQKPPLNTTHRYTVWSCLK